MSPLPPVMNLSVEILSYIFELADSAHQEETGLASQLDCFTRRKHVLPIHISHVSQYFRDVALSTTSLWNIIHVSNLHDSQVEYIEACVNRSGKVSPLDVHLAFTSGCQPHASRRDDVFAHVMTLIQANTYRLQGFAATFSSPESVHLTLKFLDYPAPRLTKLMLQYTGDPHGNPSPGPFVPFGGQMNQLKMLYLDFIGISWSQCAFANLNVLILRDLSKLNLASRPSFWSLIRNSPSLRKLDISNDSTILLPVLGQDIHNSSITLNSLTELRLSSITTNDALELISRIHAPHIQSLSLGGLWGGGFSQFLEKFLGPPLLFSQLNFIELSDNSTYRASIRLSSAYPMLKSEWKTFDNQDKLTFSC